MAPPREVNNPADSAKKQPSLAEQFLQDFQERQQRRKHGDATQAPGRAPQDSSDRNKKQGNSVFSQNFDNPITHLDLALAHLKAHGPRSKEAMSEYYAAMRAADGINQDEVKQERKRVKEELETTTDTNKKRKLVKWDLYLHDMQRAPGFTRANLGMVLVRAGYEGDGIRLIVEAGAKDPEMRKDPNYIRHMEKLNRQAASAGQQADQAASGGGAPQTGTTADTTQQPAAPGDKRSSGGGTPDDNTGGGQPAGSPDNFHWTGDAAAKSGGAGGDNTSKQPQGDQTRTQGDGQLEDPVAHLQAARLALRDTLQLSPEIRAEFEKAVAAADKLHATMKVSETEAQKYYNKEREDKIAALTTQRDTLKQTLQTGNPESFKQLGALAVKWAQSNETERKAIETDMAKVPGATPLMAKQKELDAAEADPDHQKYVTLLAQTFPGQAKLLGDQARNCFDKQLEEKIAKLDQECTALEAAFKKDYKADYDQYQNLSDQRKTAAIEAIKKAQAGDKAGQTQALTHCQQLEAQIAKVPHADALLKKEKELDHETSKPAHVQFAEVIASAELLKQQAASPFAARLDYAIALATNVSQIDQVLKGNLTDVERAMLKVMSEQTTLKPDQKTALAAIAGADNLTDAQRTQLKQIATDTQLTAEQKEVMTAIAAQFNLTEADKKKYQDASQQDKTTAAKQLDEMFKKNSEIGRNEDFIAVAKAVGYEIPKVPVSDKAQDQAPTIQDLTKTAGHPIDLLTQAHQAEKEKDFAAAKPFYEKAITAADSLPAQTVQKKVADYTAIANDASQNAASRQQAALLAAEYSGMQQSPFATRFQYAIALNNAAAEHKPGGDAAAAKKQLEDALKEATKLDPKAGESALFLMVKDKIDKGEKITADDLKKVTPADRTQADYTTTAGDSSVGMPKLEQIQAAQAALSKAAEAASKKDWAGAAESYRAAIAATKDLDPAVIKARETQIDQQIAQLKGQSGNDAKVTELQEAKEALECCSNLPVRARFDLTVMFLTMQPPNAAAARDVLKDPAFLSKYPDVAQTVGYNRLRATAEEYVDNAAQAEQFWKRMVVAADKTDMAPNQKLLAELIKKHDSLPDTAEGLVQRKENERQQKDLRAEMDLPVSSRLDLATFYARHNHFDQAKALLEDKEFLAKYPDAAKNPDYKKIKAVADDNSKGAFEKAADLFRREWKGITSDFVSGTLAVVSFAAVPEAALYKRLALALVVGAVSKPTTEVMLNRGALPTWDQVGSQAGWGTLNALMFVAGGEVHSRMANRMLAGVDEAAMKEQLLKIGVDKSVVRDFALQQDLHNVGEVGNLLRRQFGESVSVTQLRTTAEKLGVSQLALRELDGKTGKTAIDAWVKLLEGHAVSGLDSRVLLQHGEALGLGATELQQLAAKQQGQRVEIIAATLKHQLGEKVDGTKLIPHATALGCTEAEAARLRGKVGTEAIDALTALLKEKAEAGRLNFGQFTEVVHTLGVDRLEMSKVLASQEPAFIDELGVALKKDASKVDAKALSAQAASMGVPAEEAAKLKGLAGADAVDAFTVLLKNRANAGTLSMEALNQQVASMGLSAFAVRELDSKRRLEAISTVERLLTARVQETKQLAGESLEIVKRYKLNGMAEGNGEALATHLRSLGAPADQLVALQDMKGAEASRTAVAILKSTIAAQEKRTETTLAVALKESSWARRLLRRPGDSAAAQEYVVASEALNKLRNETAAGRWQRLSTSLKSWNPRFEGEEGSIYREYKDLWSKHVQLRGKPLYLDYLNPFTALNIQENGAWRRPSLFRNQSSFRSLGELGARDFWNKTTADFSSIGTMSLMYRGSHNVHDMYYGNERTGQKLSGYEALRQTLYGSLQDAVLGAGLVPMARHLGGVFRHEGSVAEAVAPELSPWAKAGSGVWNKSKFLINPMNSLNQGVYASGRALSWAEQKFTVGNLPVTAPWQETTTNFWSKTSLGYRVPLYGADRAGGAALSGLGQGTRRVAGTVTETGLYGRLQLGLTTVPGSGAIFSPHIAEIPGSVQSATQVDALIERNNQPLQDYNHLDPIDKEVQEKQQQESGGDSVTPAGSAAPTAGDGTVQTPAGSAAPAASDGTAGSAAPAAGDGTVQTPADGATQPAAGSTTTPTDDGSGS